jgi:hypothetical protein
VSKAASKALVLKMKAVRFLSRSENMYQIAWYQISEDSILLKGYRYKKVGEMQNYPCNRLLKPIGL